MYKIITLTSIILILGMSLGLAFSDDFEGGNDWTVLSGTINDSISMNHTTGGMMSMVGVATFSTPANAVKQENTAAVGQRWQVTGWVYKNGGTVYFGWYDNTSEPTVSGNNTWVQVTDTYTFTSGASFNVDFYVSGTGVQAYLDDVSTSKLTPVENWELYQ